MSVNTWVISDPHFSHANILNFESSPGVPLRPFKTVEEMNETMIRNWNNVVHPQDRVYLLGDVAFNARTFHEIIPRLMGRICLVPGNHEPTKIRKYADLFDDIRGYVVKKGFIMSHIPIHEGSLSRWQINIHGHTHANNVMVDEEYQSCPPYPDERYICVCVEQIGYTPKLLSKVLEEAGVE